MDGLNRNKIELLLNDAISSVRNVSGGCINDSRIITMGSGKNYFLKISPRSDCDMFVKEANGLKEISLTGEIRVPQVIYADNSMIIMEAIRSGTRMKNFYEDFGRKFASMHRHYGDQFGFYEDNYIGSTPQLNSADENERDDWIRFYFNKRLLFQFRLAEKNGYVNESFRKAFWKLSDKIETILLCDSNNPSLLHGDLWGGNYITDENGCACLIDPAVYYGHREADLAMTRLFGGFDAGFYSAYKEEYPLDAGYEYRENIYKLYHVINHLNLFGSGYFSQALNLINFYNN